MREAINNYKAAKKIWPEEQSIHATSNGRDYRKHQRDWGGGRYHYERPVLCSQAAAPYMLQQTTGEIGSFLILERQQGSRAG
jgi:hypothetical protein